MGNLLPAKRTIGKLERLARARHARDLELAGGPGWSDRHPSGFWFDQEAGDYVVRWIQKFGRHHKGEWAGRPLILEPWQGANVSSIFGWKRAAGTRRFRRAWWEVPRKNGKTQIAGGVGLYLLVGDNEPGAEVYTTATKKDQAWICHEAARQMVKRSEELRKIVKVPKNRMANLTCEMLGSFMAILASDHGTLDGPMPHGDIRDEVHAWADAGLAEVLDTASGSRRQPLTLEITTAGVYNPEGVGTPHPEYAVDVLEGRLEDDALFVFISALDEGDEDFWDPALWWKASPNLGVSLKLDYMQDQANRALSQPSALNGFLTKLLNRWTQQVDRWLPEDRYRKAEDSKFTEEQLVGLECVGGIDLSLREDVTALVLVFRRPDGGLDMTCRFWLPQETIDEERTKGRGFWQKWADQGWLTAIPGAVIQHSYVRDAVNETSKRFNLTAVAYDPAEANLLAGELSEDGFSMVLARQGKLTLSEPSKLLEATIFQSKLRVTGPPGGPNPIFRWMVGNAVVTRNANGDIQPDKAKARGKIDGISAAVTAMTLIVGEESGGGSYLDEAEEMVVLR